MRLSAFRGRRPVVSSSAATPDRRSGGRFPPSTSCIGGTGSRGVLRRVHPRGAPDRRLAPRVATSARGRVASPKDYAESAGRRDLRARLEIDIPALIDEFDSTTEKAYTAWPDRLYVIDRDGRIAYKSRPGPFGFAPGEVEAHAGTAPRRLAEGGECTNIFFFFSASRSARSSRSAGREDAALRRPTVAGTLRIYLARHGETDWNAQRRLAGRDD